MENMNPKELEQIKKIVSVLNSTPKVTAPDSSRQELHQNLIRASRNSYYKRRTLVEKVKELVSIPRAVLAGGVVVSVVLICFIMVSSILDKMITLKKLDTFNKLSGGGDISTIGLNQSGEVQINMNSQEEVKDVDFEIDLPNGLCVVRSGQPLCSQKKLRWSGDLQKGENIVIIYVKGTIKGNWKVGANVTKNKNQKKIEIPLSVI